VPDTAPLSDLSQNQPAGAIVRQPVKRQLTSEPIRLPEKLSESLPTYRELTCPRVYLSIRELARRAAASHGVTVSSSKLQSPYVFPSILKTFRFESEVGRLEGRSPSPDTWSYLFEYAGAHTGDVQGFRFFFDCLGGTRISSR
jgi:hypothetical protein